MNHLTAQCTGQPFSATQESLSQSVETKQSLQQEQTQQPATNEQVGQCVPEATTPASQRASHASSFKSASERLAAEISSAVLFTIGAQRPDAQIRRDIRNRIVAIVSRYLVMIEGEP